VYFRIFNNNFQNNNIFDINNNRTLTLAFIRRNIQLLSKALLICCEFEAICWCYQEQVAPSYNSNY